ncbi:Splicing factor 3B subunit 1 [Kappamyces sp. JEL0680]|nr:Splicing factor 3B subunit 1 [Kappamyces sp. JEL0680]
MSEKEDIELYDFDKSQVDRCGGAADRREEQLTHAKAMQEILEAEGKDHDPMEGLGRARKVESDYQQQRYNRMLSPDRKDAFAKKGSRGDAQSYKEVMKDLDLEREKKELERKLQEQEKRDALKRSADQSHSEWEVDEKRARVDATPKQSKWDATPSGSDKWGATPQTGAGKSKWDATPASATGSRWDATPASTTGGSKWDATPVSVASSASTRALGSMTPAEIKQARYDADVDRRNKFQTDEELNALLPLKGFVILEVPGSYVPIRTPSRKLDATPLPQVGENGFHMQEDVARNEAVPEIPGVSGLEFFKQEDAQYFSRLVGDERVDSDLTLDELKERKVMRLLLKIKNGTPPVRKIAMRQITDGARLFGPASLFNQILPLLMSPTLEDQERHLLVKVIDRVMFKLDDLVRPYAHKILVVIEPMLIDQDYYARVEGREIIANLAKAAGLATMISVMRPDIDHTDEYVRNTTARAFAVVASALGIPALLPFLRAVCKSKKSWQARHTGIKIVQQIAILLGPAVLPHLKNLVSAIGDGLVDEQQKVRTVTALALAALAEAAAPYGIESFQPVLKPLFEGIKLHRGKTLAAFFKCIGFIIPLFDPEYANYYTRECMARLANEFTTSDEEMKKIVLKVIKQCVGTEGVDYAYIKQEILPRFFKNFWVRRMALDRRNYKQLVETTVEIAQKLVQQIVEDLKDDSEPFRKMVMETLDQIVASLGTVDLDDRLVEVLIDGILYAFQEQTIEDDAVLNGFGTIVTSLGIRTKPYLPQICSTILWRLNNKSAKVRQQAADLISKIANVMRVCSEEKLMGQLGVVLYEYLGEEYPEVLGSILNGLKAIVNVIGMSNMTPPIKDLLPRLTPILKNRHEKVLEHAIDLVGRIADRGAEFVSAREWMRICFELLDTLKAQRKSIRRAAINTFGYIAKAIGPQDVLSTLLNNLKVQDRQNRVCTTVAIAIVAETCSPFTVLPALMNEYRVPEMNVQNGCLKALSFLFEYIGEMGKDYIWAVSTLLEDALMDRDLVHRQTACATVKQMALGVVGLGCEDAIQHMLNLVWPNIFETSPHVINAVMEALEGCRVALGPATMLQYVLQGLFHPARRVREVYWKIESDDRNDWARHEMDLVV